MKLSDIKANPDNPRVIKDEAFNKLVQSIKDFPKMMALRPMVVDDNLTVLGGNMRLRALRHLGYKDIPDEWVKRASDLTEEEQKQFIIKDNVSVGDWDWDTLANNWDARQLTEWGIDFPTWQEVETEKEQNKKLSDRFIIPPFSILNAKSGEWTQRKNYWLSLGIKSEEGRDNNLLESLNKLAKKSGQGEQKDNSIFDPVLCELAYKWFNIPNGKILDCFAGGSVRGIVAAKLGYEYLGNDLRSEQIEANRINAKEVLQD